MIIQGTSRDICAISATSLDTDTGRGGSVQEAHRGTSGTWTFYKLSTSRAALRSAGSVRQTGVTQRKRISVGCQRELQSPHPSQKARYRRATRPVVSESPSTRSPRTRQRVDRGSTASPAKPTEYSCWTPAARRHVKLLMLARDRQTAVVCTVDYVEEYAKAKARVELPKRRQPHGASTSHAILFSTWSPRTSTSASPSTLTNALQGWRKRVEDAARRNHDRLRYPTFGTTTASGPTQAQPVVSVRQGARATGYRWKHAAHEILYPTAPRSWPPSPASH